MTGKWTSPIGPWLPVTRSYDALGMPHLMPVVFFRTAMTINTIFLYLTFIFEFRIPPITEKPVQQKLSLMCYGPSLGTLEENVQRFSVPVADLPD